SCPASASCLAGTRGVVLWHWRPPLFASLLLRHRLLLRRSLCCISLPALTSSGCRPNRLFSFSRVLAAVIHTSIVQSGSLTTISLFPVVSSGVRSAIFCLCWGLTVLPAQ